MSDGAPALEVGFEIDTTGSFAAIEQLETGMDRATAAIVADAEKVERATGGMISLSGATAEINTFGAASTRALRDAAREAQQAERAGEGMLRQLARQNDAFGKSRSELRHMRVEERALAAERTGNSELARRLREQEAELWAKEAYAARQAGIAKENAAQDAMEAADREAESIRKAAHAHQMFQARVREGVIAMREQTAAEVAAAAARDDLAQRAQRLVASIDPAAAAQDRFNKEMAEARLLISEGAITLDQYSAKLLQQQGVLDAAGDAMARGGVSASAHRQAMMGASYQVQDFITQVSMGANPINAFAVQGAQLAGQFANIEGKAGNVARFFMGPWGLALTAAAMLAGMLTKELFASGEEADKAKNKSLDLSHAIDFQSMSTQDLIKSIGELEDAQQKQLKSAQQLEIQSYNNAQAALYEANMNRRLAISYYEKLKAIRQEASGPLMGGAGMYGNAGLRLQSNVSGEIAAVESEIEKLSKSLVSAENLVRTTRIPIMNREVEESTNAAARATGNYERALDNLKDRFLAGTVTEQAYLDQRQRLTQQNEAAQKAIRDAEKDGGSTRGNRAELSRIERLEREGDAIEAQIKNHYGLADAYRVSGAAAFAAEARVKAESSAIKQRGDISEAVERQIRLAIAERVSESAKATSAMLDQAEAQRIVNDMVEAGLLPSERAAELVQDQLADLPLLTALQAAQNSKNLDGIKLITVALEDQRKAREDIRAEEKRSQFNAAMEAGRGRLAELREEGRLIRANDEQRVIGMARFKAEQESLGKGEGWDTDAYVKQQVKIAEEQIRLAQQQNDINQELSKTADLYNAIDENARFAAQGMSEAFGSVGAALGGLLTITTGYHAADQRMQDERDERIAAAGNSEAAILRENRLFALRSSALQVGAYGDMAAAAKGFFKEGTSGYRAMAVAEKAFRAVEFALSVRAMAQDAIETAQKLASGGARIAVGATEAVVKAIKELPWPLNIAAGAATIGALASIGVSVGGAFGGSGKSSITPANEGKGTVFGDADAKSESIKRSIDALREVDLLTANYSRDMLNSLRSIDNQIGGFASLVLRTGGINADLGIREGFQTDTTGKLLKSLVGGGGLFNKVPIIGDILGGIGSLVGSLFGSKTSVVGSGLFGGPQSLESIMSGGFDASYYSDIKKTKKFFGISTGSSYSTQYAGADPALENQFTLVLRSFYEAVSDAAGPLGVATSDIQRRLNGFIVDIGKIDTRDLTGSELQDKLTAVFGAAADRMASAAFPGMERFQKAGEGMFETLVRVASTVESVTGLFNQLGRNVAGIGIDAQLALVDQFGSLNDLSSATQSYFETFYTREEQAKARLAQFNSVFAHMGITLPNTLAGFRQLVEAQDLTTAAGREVYATLLQVAPAFADLQSALNGARSAADILSERQDLQRKLLEVQGDTEALRALDLAKLDVSNRALQKQIWAIQDAQEAAKAADELRKAWTGVGDSLLDEVKRIRGLTNGSQGGTFAQLMGQFNAASASARGGDIEAAKLLPGLSQSLLSAAEKSATSRQELDRVRAQVAANLEATHGATLGYGTAPKTTEQLLESLATTVAAAAQPANDSLIAEFQNMKNDLRTAIEKLRIDANAGLAATASNTGAIKRKLDDVSSKAGGTAIAMVAA